MSTVTTTDTPFMLIMAWQQERCSLDIRNNDAHHRERTRRGGFAMSYCTLGTTKPNGLCLSCLIRNEAVSRDLTRGVPQIGNEKLMKLYKQAAERGCSKNERRDCFQRKDGDPCVYCRTRRLLIHMEDSE